MKLSKHAFQRFLEVHAWAGVLGGLLLTVMFAAGAFALFHHELDHWLNDAASGARASAPERRFEGSLEALLAPYLDDPKLHPERFDITLPSEEHHALEVWYQRAPDEWESVTIDPESGATTRPQSNLAGVIFGLHYLWHDDVPWLMYVAGLLSLALLLALTTGVLIHLKDLVRQLWQFRPLQKARVLWLDMHKVLGLFGLPFQLLYGFTGVLLIFSSWLAAPFVGSVFATQEDAEHALWGESEPEDDGSDAERAKAPRAALDLLLARARAEQPGGEPTRIVFERLNQRGGTASIRQKFFVADSFPRETEGAVKLNASDGALISTRMEATKPPVQRAIGALYTVHFAGFGGLPLRFLFALLSLATCLTVLTGNWVWLLKREKRAASFGNQLLARSTVAVGAGFPFAIALAFVCNRLWPSTWGESSAWEGRVLFTSWLLLAVLCLAQQSSLRQWTRLLFGAGCAYTALPLASLVAGRPSLLRLGVGTSEAVELVLLAFGLALIASARALGRRGDGAREKARAREPQVERGIADHGAVADA